MSRAGHTLAEIVAGSWPDAGDPAALIAAGRITVDGFPVTNPRSRPKPGAAVALSSEQRLRGSVKLEAALDGFGVAVEGRVALDVGAAAGGFTSVLLERGARRVYAVDAGHGQLLGALRQEPRVINLERTNLGALDSGLVAEAVELVTVDVSYLSLADAIPQLHRVGLAAGAQLVALVKPMFELHASKAPTDAASLERAIDLAAAAAERDGWGLRGRMRSAVTGAAGAVEGWIWAQRPS